MKDMFHQALFLFGAVLVITLLRLILGPWIQFLGSTNITLYLMLNGILFVVVIVLFVLSRKK